MDVTFDELYRHVPRGRRTDGIRALIAMFVLVHVDSIDAPTTRDVLEVIRLNQPAARPANMATTLRRLSPYVQPVRGGSKRETHWRLRPRAVALLEEATGVDLSVVGERSGGSISLSTLHPEIRKAAEHLVRNRHYGEAVGRAAKALNRLVRERTDRRRDEGTPMMHQVFNCASNSQKRLLLNSLEHEWEEDQQDGFRFLMAGAQQGIANVDKHGELAIDNEMEAMEHLAMLSLLARKVERARVAEPESAAVS